MFLLSGNKKFELHVTFQTSVGDLCAEIERETEIPVHCQRIIYNGRALNNHAEDMNKHLGTLGLKSPAKVLVLGKKADEEDENYKLMKKWEVSCDSLARQLNGFEKDILELERVFAHNNFYILPILVYVFNFYTFTRGLHLSHWLIIYQKL